MNKLLQKRHVWMYDDDIRLAKIRSAELGIPMSQYLRRLLRERQEKQERERNDNFKFY